MTDVSMSNFRLFILLKSSMWGKKDTNKNDFVSVISEKENQSLARSTKRVI